MQAGRAAPIGGELILLNASRPHASGAAPIQACIGGEYILLNTSRPHASGAAPSGCNNEHIELCSYAQEKNKSQLCMVAVE